MKVEKSNAPNGWRTVKLGEVCEINPRRSEIIRADGAPTTFLPMPAIGEAGAGIVKPEIRRYAEVRRGYTCFAEGDVLFAKITPCMQNGKHAIARNLLDGIGFGSTEFHVLRPRDGIISEWILNFLLQPRVSAEAERHFTGAVGQQRVPENVLADMEIPLPPVPEQRRIAARLREQMAAVERARAAVQAQLDAAQTLPAALLRAVFTSPAAKNWPRRKLGDVIQVQSGYAFKSDWFVDAGIRLLRNVNVSQGCTNWDDTAFLPENRRAEFPDYELSEGDIILSLDRPVVSGGLKLTRLTKNDLPALLLQRVGRFILKGEIDAGFLHHFLQTNDFICKITAHDQSLGVPHVSPKQIEQIEIPLPDSLAEQRAIAERLETELSSARALDESLSARLAEIERLPAALLREAFNGN